MTECYETGQLRAYLEGPDALPADERTAIEAHLAACPQCRERRNELRALGAAVTARIAALAPTREPDVQAALMTMRGKLRQESASYASAPPPQPGPLSPNRSNTMQPFAL